MISSSNKKNIIFNDFRCRFPKTCIPYPTYQKINPNTQNIIDGVCQYGCLSTDFITYRYIVYFTNYVALSPNSNWIQVDDNFDLISGII